MLSSFNHLCCIYNTSSIDKLRILILEFFSGEAKSSTDMLEDERFKEYVEILGEAKLKEFLAGLTDPAGLIFYTGSTKNRRYRTTKRGRSALLLYTGQVDWPDPDESEDS